jgi:hypothetical protein
MGIRDFGTYLISGIDLSKMMTDPRVGLSRICSFVTGAQWVRGSIGKYTMAMGLNTKASTPTLIEFIKLI